MLAVFKRSCVMRGRIIIVNKAKCSLLKFFKFFVARLATKMPDQRTSKYILKKKHQVGVINQRQCISYMLYCWTCICSYK